MKVMCMGCLGRFSESAEETIYMADGRFMCKLCFIHDAMKRRECGMPPAKVGIRGREYNDDTG